MERSKPRWSRWMAVSGALLCTLPASAAARSPDQSDRQWAAELSQQAEVALRQGRWEIAAARYHEAWEFFRDPWFQCNLGGVYLEMGKPAEAAQSLSACLRLLKPANQKFARPKIERDLKEARSKVGALRVDVNVPDAEVFVNGKTRGKLPLEDPLFLDPGSHEVEVKAPGYVSDLRIAVLSAGTSMSIQMRLDPMRVEVAPPVSERPPIEPKALKVESAPPKPLPTPPAITKEPVTAIIPERVAEPARAPVRTATIVTGFGLGVAGAVVGTAGVMAASATGNEAKEMYRALAEGPAKCTPAAPGPCKDAEDKTDTARMLMGVGVAGFAMSAVHGALIVYELLRPDSQGRKVAASLSVQPAHDGGALKVTGSF